MFAQQGFSGNSVPSRYVWKRYEKSRSQARVRDVVFSCVVSHCFPLSSPNKFANPGQTLIDLNLQQFHLGKYQYSMIHSTKARQEHTQIALTTLKQCSHSTHTLLDGWKKASSLALITDAITCP